MQLMDYQVVVDSKPTIGILILNHNGMSWLPSLYEAIKGNRYPNIRIYLVDNASDDESVKITLDSYPEVSIIRMPINLGYCMAYNLAMPQAFAEGCNWVIWANNDVKLEAGCLSAMVEAAQSDARIGVAGPAFLSWEKDEPNYYILGNYPQAIPAIENRSPKPMDVDWVEGSFLMVSRRCIESVGPLDPYLVFYCEESDFCRRARYRGWRIVLVPKALARHYAGGWSEGKQQNKETANWLRARNYYIYHLANPFQSFLKNLLDGMHLFIVKIKDHIRHSPTWIFLEMRVFLLILIQLKTIHRKWRRDMKGHHPPAMIPELQSLSAQILTGQNHFERRQIIPPEVSRVNG